MRRVYPCKFSRQPSASPRRVRRKAFALDSCLVMAAKPHRPPCGRSVGGFRPPPGAQVSAEQALAVQSALLRFGRNASLLVFGLGNDAPMWHNMTAGRVAFIEDSSDWVERAVAAAPYLEAHVARYTQGTLGTAKATFRAKGGVWPQLDLRDQLPRSVHAHRWDVVVVDAPQAGARTNPGRQQSIYTAACLARPGGVIFVDDCERDNEAFFAASFLGAVVGSVRRAECLGRDHRSGREKLIAANRRCEYRAPGAQGRPAGRLGGPRGPSGWSERTSGQASRPRTAIVFPGGLGVSRPSSST